MMIEEIWKSLENEARGDTGECIIKRRVMPESPFDVYLGLETPGNRRMLLLKSLRSLIVRNELYPKSKGLEMRTVQLPDDDDAHATLELVLTDSRFADVFTCLVQDVMEQIVSEKDESSMIKTFTGRLLKWQQFLDKYTQEGLSIEAQRGLYGELWFLKQYMITLLGAGGGINTWKGPEGSPQDFRHTGLAVEVKTTTGKQHERILISNEQQLDDTGLESLFLFHISLIELSDDKVTLPILIDDIRKLAESNPGAISRFNALLVESGYLEAQRERYSGRGYAVRSFHIYNVKEGFPRIIFRDLRNGVGDVRYSINVSECKHFGINDRDFQKLLEGGI